MATTALTPTATPGRPYSFTPKTPAGGGGARGADRFTALGAMALPGCISTFSPKGGAGLGKGPGRITALAVIGTPGRVQAFAPKAEFIPPEPVAPVPQPPKYVLHGFNRMRLLQWGGRYRPKR